MGAIKWFPELATACNQDKNQLSAGTTFGKKADISLLKGITLETIATNLKAAYKDYTALKKQASSVCNTFIEWLAKAQAHNCSINETTHLKTLHKWEWQWLTYCWIQVTNQPDCQYRGPQNGSECHTKDSIEQACLMKNQGRFNQAFDTPYCNPHCMDYLVFWGPEVLTLIFFMANSNILVNPPSKIPSMYSKTAIHQNPFVLVCAFK